MATADTARLIASLELKNSSFNRGVDQSIGKMGKLESRAGKLGGAFKTGIKAAGVAVAAAASVAVIGITGAIKGGLQDLATLENATTSVDAAIKQMGKSGKVSAGQVAQWANEIEADIGAAFDDKEIVAATGTLIRFGKLTTANIKPAMQVMTDLAVKTGSVESASTLLAKALADPTKAAGKLARAGVILTKEQQKQIKAFVKAGETGKAQRVILDALTKSTKGAAAASQGPYQRALSVLADVSEDAKKALAEGFLPVIERVSKKLSTILADPKAIQSIRDFGKGIAGAFDKAVDFLEGVDWKSAGDGLRSAFDWGKKLVGVFNSMPDDAKALIIGLAGLTKLTGGAPIKIAVDFAKGALSGVFGHFFERGSSPANPLFVQGAGLGGATGPGGVGGGGGGLAQGIQVVAGAGFALAVGQAMREASGTLFSNIFPPEVATTLQKISNSVNPLPNIVTTLESLPKLPGQIADLINGPKLPGSGVGTDFAGGRGAPGGGTKALVDKTEAVKAAVDASKAGILESQGTLDQSILASRDAINDTKARVAAVVSAGTVIGANATRSGAGQVAGQVGASGNAIVGAVRASRDVVNVYTNVQVSAWNVTQTQTQVSRTSQNSSKTNDERHYGG